jgi:hypothetical protein
LSPHVRHGRVGATRRAVCSFPPPNRRGADTQELSRIADTRHATPIAPGSHRSVQSGFNEVAHEAAPRWKRATSQKPPDSWRSARV